jgi:hypothetical protein
MRSHTGGVLSMGRGAIYGTSTRQKLTTKSSTEAELVGVSDILPQVLWTRYFLEAQGYDINDNLLYQDNKSAILLEKNGKMSSGKRTRHINIRYFFVTDRIENKELRVEYCPTGSMLADFFTKPLQGGLFMKFRDQVMGVVPTVSIDMSDHRSVLELGTSSVPTPGGTSSVPTSSIKDTGNGKQVTWNDPVVTGEWTVVKRYRGKHKMEKK